MLTSFVAAATAVLLLHPVHETVSEVEWNPKTKCLEVALRLHQLDEQWISRQPSHTDRAGWQADYLQHHLYFDPQKDPKADGGFRGKPIRWVGRKEQDGYAWWFFEVVCKNGKPPRSVRTRLLFDYERGYQHRIILLDCVKQAKAAQSKDDPDSDDQDSDDRDSDDRDSDRDHAQDPDDCAVVLTEQHPQAELDLTTSPKQP